MTNKRNFISPAIHCIECGLCLARESKRKYEWTLPDPQMVCEACQIKTPFLRAFKRLEMILDKEEKDAYRKHLSEIVDLTKELEQYCLKMHGEGMPYNDAAEKLLSKLALICLAFMQ